MPSPWLVSVAETLGVVGIPLVGAIIVSRLPRLNYGWVWLGLGVVISMVDAPLLHLLALPEWIMNLSAGWFFIAFMVLLVMVLLLFPDGTLPSLRWRWVQRAAWIAGAVAAVLAIVTRPEFGPATPLVIDGRVGRLLTWLLEGAVFVLFALLVLSAAAVPVRWRRADRAQRQQLKWFMWGAIWFVPGTLYTAFFDFLLPPWVDALVFITMFGGLEAAVVIAILRHGLYDVDRVINRTLLYAGLSACLVAVYVGVVALVPWLLGRNVPDAARALATSAVALLVLPLRSRLQRAVNRLTFGQRGDPYDVLADLGRRLEASGASTTVLPDIVESVAATLRLPYVALELYRDGEFTSAALFGHPLTQPTSFPLNHHGELVGRLLVSPRAAAETLSATDRRLLTDLARHAGVAAHAVLLEEDLRRSRARVLAAREEERRRLSRDLHDGLGPSLAAVGLGLESAARRCQDSPERAVALLQRLSTDVQATISDIRRLVHDLRPPVLDQYGLVDAVRAEARRFETEAGLGTSSLTIHVDAPTTAPPLPAAVEVAAYRIVAEALTNMVKHAHAQQGVIRLRFEETLDIEVRDDGQGLPPTRGRGIGLTSMVERAADVGGRCEIMAIQPSGTRVRAQLPLEVTT